MIVFTAAAIMSLLGALVSWFRGKTFIFDEEPAIVPDKSQEALTR